MASNSSNSAAVLRDGPSAGRVRRFAEGTLAVAVWIAIGIAFHLSANAYLLVGVPITIVFQRYVRRAPLLAVWVRTAPRFHLGMGGIAIAILLTVTPSIGLVQAIGSRLDAADAGWMIAAMAGAWGAAYALRNFSSEAFRELLICLVTAGVAGCAIMIGFAFLNGAPHSPAWPNVRRGLLLFAQYVPVTFVLEEVWFRGVLDSHLHHPGEPRGILSAAYGSALWGVWHYPTIGPQENLEDLFFYLGSYLLVSVIIGTLLVRAWRRSGNLLVSGVVHALIDAFGIAIS